ncbi:MAG: FliH/SctL family protein, partial [bacterium]
AQAEAAAVVNAAQSNAQRIKEQAAQEIEALKAASAQDAENAKKEAYSGGYSTGEETGFKEGYQAGYTKGKNQSIEEIKNSLNMISRTIEELKAYRSDLLNEARNDIVKMAVNVAERVLHKEIMTDPNSVVSVVKNAIKKVNFKKQFLVHVNPLDLEVLQQQNDEIAALLESYELLKFAANPKVEPGGCIIQTESGTVDARVDRQFQEIKEQVLGALKEEEQ